MGGRLVRSGRVGVVTLIIAIGLIGSAWLAYAATPPSGNGSGVYPGTTTTTKSTSTTIPKTTTTVCKPGNGFGDKNHCHSGPPGQNKKDDDNGNGNGNNKNGHK